MGYNGELTEGLALAKEIKEKYSAAMEGYFSHEIDSIMSALQKRNDSTIIKVII